VLIGCAIFGYRRGLLNQIVELAGLVAGILLALYLTGGLVANYAKPLASYRITYPIVFLAIVGISLLVSQVIGRVTAEVMEVTFFGVFDQLGGPSPGSPRACCGFRSASRSRCICKSARWWMTTCGSRASRDRCRASCPPPSNS
jgi:hypothetical protein